MGILVSPKPTIRVTSDLCIGDDLKLHLSLMANDVEASGLAYVAHSHA
jgi:hypothetical protein